MTDTCLLKSKIEESGYKISFIADSLKMTRQCLNNKVNNVTEFKASEINTLCELLHIDVHEKEKIFFATDVDN